MPDIKYPGDCTDTGCCAPIKPKPLIIEFVYNEAHGKRNESLWKLLEAAIEDVSKILNSSGLYIEAIKKEADHQVRGLPHIIINKNTRLESDCTKKQLRGAIINSIYNNK